MKKTMLVLSFILCGMVILFGACQKSTPSDFSEDSTSSSVESSLVVPTAAADSCVISGRLVDQKTNKAPKNAVYLAENITADIENVPTYLSFSHTDSPRATIDENGFFYFKDVPEGQFTILLFNPGGSPVFIDNGHTDETKDYLWVDAVPGENVDMGSIYVP